MLPAVVSQLVVVLMDTTLGGVLLGYAELMRHANILTANFSNSVATYTVVMDLVLSMLARQVERWMRHRRGQKPAVTVALTPVLDASQAAQLARVSPRMPVIRWASSGLRRSTVRRWVC
jgi:glutamate transport system permease protein